MKTFEEAVKILDAVNVERFEPNQKEMWENLKQEEGFQELMRMAMDDILIRLIKKQSITTAVMLNLVAIAQTFLTIGMEMEKE